MSLIVIGLFKHFIFIQSVLMLYFSKKSFRSSKYQNYWHIAIDKILFLNLYLSLLVSPFSY